MSTKEPNWVCPEYKEVDAHCDCGEGEAPAQEGPLPLTQTDERDAWNAEAAEWYQEYDWDD